MPLRCHGQIAPLSAGKKTVPGQSSFGHLRQLLGKNAGMR